MPTKCDMGIFKTEPKNTLVVVSAFYCTNKTGEKASRFT